MKSASLFLSLMACGQAPQDTMSAPELVLEDSTDSLSLSVVSIHPTTAPDSLVATSTTLGPIDVHPETTNKPEHQDEPENAPVLVCASSAAWSGISPSFDTEEVDPELMYSISRISVFESEDGHTAVIETGSAHNPDTIFGTITHENVYFEMGDDYLDLTWEDSYIMGWRTPEYGPIFNGGGWGDIAAPIVSTDEPPPPCGFEVYVSCWEPDNAQSPFQYDPKQGECVNKNQQVGLNYKPVEYIRETGDGECAELSWSMLSEGITFDIELNDWDLRGAKLEYASLGTLTADESQAPTHSLVNAQLEGADLSLLDTFNATITGSIDAHTQLPDIDCIIDDEALVDCEG